LTVGKTADFTKPYPGDSKVLLPGWGAGCGQGGYFDSTDGDG
jgi:hypothetical protein